MISVSLSRAVGSLRDNEWMQKTKEKRNPCRHKQLSVDGRMGTGVINKRRTEL